MLIIRKITRCKNSLKRKLQIPFEAANLCNLMIVKEFRGFCVENFFYKLFHNTRVKIRHHKKT